MPSQNRITIRTIAMTGVLAAVVFAVSKFYIPIPTPLGNTRLHFGNVMCLLSGLLLGPVPGGLAAGIGSFFFDLTDPLFFKDAFFTLAFKFAMGWTCGKIAHGRSVSVPVKVVGAAAGALLYVALYLGRNFVEYYFLHGMELPAVMISVGAMGVASGLNAVLAVAAAVPLSLAIQKGLARVNLSLD